MQINDLKCIKTKIKKQANGRGIFKKFLHSNIYIFILDLIFLCFHSFIRLFMFKHGNFLKDPWSLWSFLQYMSPWLCKCGHLMPSHATAFGSDLCHRRRCSPSRPWLSSCVLCACEVVPGFQVCEVGSCAHLLAHVLPEAAFCRTDHILPRRSLCYLQKTGSWCTNDLQIINKLPTGRVHVTFKAWGLAYI